MKHKFMHAFGLVVLGSVGLATSPADAVTTANGSYYATPSWDQQLPAPTRFVVLSNWNSEAVLDRETGLVWATKPGAGMASWSDALFECRTVVIGNRRGWRVPSQEELSTLLDPTQSAPALPAGHPFQGIGATDSFWTATTWENDPSQAYPVSFDSAFGNGTVNKTLGLLRFW